jgi:hypothetical protein
MNGGLMDPATSDNLQAQSSVEDAKGTDFKNFSFLTRSCNLGSVALAHVARVY